MLTIPTAQDLTDELAAYIPGHRNGLDQRITITGGDHFAAGERLLDQAAENGLKPEVSIAYATRAQGHFTAARLLLDIEVTTSRRRGLAAALRSGLEKIARTRRANDTN